MTLRWIRERRLAACKTLAKGFSPRATSLAQDDSDATHAYKKKLATLSEQRGAVFGDTRSRHRSRPRARALRLNALCRSLERPRGLPRRRAVGGPVVDCLL